MATLFLFSPILFSCGPFKDELKGTALCLVLAPLTSSKTHLLHCNKGKVRGEPEDRHYYNDNGTLVTAQLLYNESEKGFEEGSLVLLEEVNFAKAVAFEND